MFGKEKKKESDDKVQDLVIALSTKEALVLEMLIVAKRELFGLEMVEASSGLLKRGTIYVVLQRMEKQGLVESRKEERPEPEIGIARRMYNLTNLGKQVFFAYKTAREGMAKSLLALSV